MDKTKTWQERISEYCIINGITGKYYNSIMWLFEKEIALAKQEAKEEAQYSMLNYIGITEWWVENDKEKFNKYSEEYEMWKPFNL